MYFCKLADPARYVACSWNLTEDAEGRVLWVEFFKRQIVTILKVAVEAAIAGGESPASALERADQCGRAIHARYNEFLHEPQRFGRVTIITFDIWRDGLLREFGFPDPFHLSKDRENGRMLPLLPVVCRQLDAMAGAEQVRAVIEGIFAGNIFDLGSEATAQSFLSKSPDFFAVRAGLAPRPWLRDGFDALVERLLKGRPYRRMVYFVDNAGSDVLLGALPMMRWMAMRGTHVVLAANELPTLNDITIHDLRRWWPRILGAEPSLAGLPIELVSTGTAEPLIDFTSVSDELNAASADADFVVLEGMGRAVESNYEAEFSCDALNIAMIKMAAVAHRCGGNLYDLVCWYR